MRKGEKMKISEFFEYNNQQVLEENENILEYLEQIFGKSTEIDREGKKEFTFGKVIGLVTDSFLDEKTKRPHSLGDVQPSSSDQQSQLRLLASASQQLPSFFKNIDILLKICLRVLNS